MNDVTALLVRCRSLGATLTPLRDRLRIHAPKPLPDDVVTDLREAKAQVLTELKWQLAKEAECWLLEEWRKVSIPKWRRILRENVHKQDRNREEYARWMLREVLEDPEYMEE